MFTSGLLVANPVAGDPLLLGLSYALGSFTIPRDGKRLNPLPAA